VVIRQVAAPCCSNQAQSLLSSIALFDINNEGCFSTLSIYKETIAVKYVVQPEFYYGLEN